jgi:hypothetical protein
VAPVSVLVCASVLAVLAVPAATSSAQATAAVQSPSGLAATTKPRADPTRLWAADVEEGNLADWYVPAPCACPRGNYGGGEFNSGNADSQASRDVAHSGRWSAKLVQRPGGGGTRLFRWREPRRYSEAYYSVWLYFPREYTAVAGWWDVFQWKSKSPAGANDPFWVVNVLNRPEGPMYLSLYDQKARRAYSQSIANVPVGRWFHVEARLRQSPDGHGRIVVWQDGAKLWELNGITTKFPGGDQSWSVNNYSDDVQPGPAVVYADDARIGRRRDPNAPRR